MYIYTLVCFTILKWLNLTHLRTCIGLLMYTCISHSIFRDNLQLNVKIFTYTCTKLKLYLIKILLFIQNLIKYARFFNLVTITSCNSTYLFSYNNQYFNSLLSLVYKMSTDLTQWYTMVIEFKIIKKNLDIASYNYLQMTNLRTMVTKFSIVQQLPISEL